MPVPGTHRLRLTLNAQSPRLQSIALIGPMGAGKTAIGRQLARALDYPFHDTDHEIERRTGVELSLVFELEGEEGFRQREHAVLEELLDLGRIVIATGGGTILNPANRALLGERALVIYLETSIEVQAARTQRTAHRPLLAGADRAERQTKLAELFKQREVLYRELAQIRINTDHKHVRTVAREILQRLQTEDSDEA